jgi:hypothetical protein
MSTANPYCQALGIPLPSIEAAWERPDANYFSLLIVALLERGEPITLVEAAQRFEQAGVASADSALASLQRCKPGRPPIYRDGDLYALDPHDHETKLWVFRLGLKPHKARELHVVRPEPGPLPSPDEQLSVAHLDEAWRHGVPGDWSAQRVAICVLDAHAVAMPPDRVTAFVASRSKWSRLSHRSAKYWRRGAAIRVWDDGMWELDLEHDAVRSARQAVRERVALIRRQEPMRPDSAVVEAMRRRDEMERQANARRLAGLRRVLVHPFPARSPEAIVLVDVGRREIVTFMGEEIARARENLAEYDLIVGVDVRAVLRRLGFEPGQRRLAELGPPQKTKQLNQRGRTLKITTTLLVRGSCGISRPFADEKLLRRYLRGGERTRFRRRLEADAKSLLALYQYGRLHGAVRLRWGFLDEMIPAPWVDYDEPTLYRLMKRAHGLGVPLEVVVGGAPGWADPWSRVQCAYVEEDDQRWRPGLVDEQGYVIDEYEIQLARLDEQE